MWTPLPLSEFSTAGRVAVSVLPSPVRISAIEPSCRTMPPMSWTSKWRWPRARLPASRVRAKDSGSSSSIDSPPLARSRSPSARSRSSSSESSSSSASQSPILATRRSNSLNFFPSPIRRARSSNDIGIRLAVAGGAPGAFFALFYGRASGCRLRCRGARFDLRGEPAPALLVAVALDLAGQLVGRHVHRLGVARRGVAGAQRRALQPEGDLGDLRVGNRRIALLRQLDVALRERRDLLGDLLEALRDSLPKLVADHNVAAFHLD